MSLDMYSERVASASALIREFAKVDYFHYFARDPESSLEEFIAMQDSAHAAGRESALAELHPQWREEKERADKALERIAELERQLAAQPQQVSDLNATQDQSFWNSQRKMIERAIVGLRDGWATRKDADDALAALAASQHKAVLVPSGWQLVPKEPSLEMVIAGENYIGRHAYAKMLAAAPTTPIAEGDQSNEQELSHAAFEAWANLEGYDTANTHNGVKLIWLNPMTADLWKAYSAALEHVGGIQQQEPEKPAMYCVDDGNGKPQFGKGWVFAPIPSGAATMPIYTRPAPAPQGDLPPLPKATYKLSKDGLPMFYDADDLRAYGQACAEAARQPAPALTEQQRNQIHFAAEVLFSRGCTIDSENLHEILAATNQDKP